MLGGEKKRQTYTLIDIYTVTPRGIVRVWYRERKCVLYRERGRRWVVRLKCSIKNKR